MTEFLLNAEKRSDAGKGASRRLRRLQKKVPAIIYGGAKDPESIQLELRQVTKLLEDEAAYSGVLTLDVEGTKEEALIRDLQRHPSKQTVTHIDFQRVDASQPIRVSVPLHFINEAQCHGVKMQGGAIGHSMSQVEVMALPKDIPEFIEVDCIGLSLGQKLHLSDIELPEGVTIIALTKGEDHDHPVAAVHATRASRSGGDEEAVEGEEGEEAAEEGGEE